MCSLLKSGVGLINITGPRGVGKTEVALQAVEYARVRNAFSRFLFVDFTKLRLSQSECLQKLLSAFSVTSDHLFTFGPPQHTNNVIEQICQHMSNRDEKVLLLLDGLDEWLKSREGGFLRGLIDGLRDRLGHSVSLLLTSSFLIDLTGVVREVVVGGLPDLCAAKLFSRRAPRDVTHDELQLEYQDFNNPYQAFSKSKLLKSMEVI